MVLRHLQPAICAKHCLTLTECHSSQAGRKLANMPWESTKFMLAELIAKVRLGYWERRKERNARRSANEPQALEVRDSDAHYTKAAVLIPLGIS